MKNFLLVSALILTLSSCQNFLSKDEKSKIIVSKYSGGKVSLKEAEKELLKITAKTPSLKDLEFSNLTEEQKEVIVKEIIVKRATIKQAKEKKLNREEDYKEAIEIFTEELLNKKFYIELAKEATTEEKLKKSYEDLSSKLEGKKEKKVYYILLDDEKKAEKYSKILKRSPKYFQNYAKKYSIDKKTAKEGGSLGYILVEALPAEIAKEILSLKKNQVSDPIQFNNNFVIARYVDERDYEVPSYEDSLSSLKDALGKKAIKEFIENILENADIEIIENIENKETSK